MDTLRQHERMYGYRTVVVDDVMAALCDQAKDVRQCAKAMDDMTEILKRWTWDNEGVSPKLASALVVATFLQSAWQIRPQVGISGTSGSGKSDLIW